MLKYIPLILLSGVLILRAEIRRVPEEYPTIQAGVDAALAGDTVLVAMGTYAENVQIPIHALTLKGDVVPDTGEYPRPIIDPSSLPDPQTQRCLTVQGGAVTVEDIAFRNDWRMYPHAFNPGGLENQSDSTVLRRCLFDSIYHCVRSLDYGITLEGCVFLSTCQRFCLDVDSHPVTATDCFFAGQSQWGLVDAGSGSRFERCCFRDNAAGGHLILLLGRNQSVKDCVFGPFGPSRESALWGHFWDSAIENCVFASCTTGTHLVQLWHCECGHPVVFRNNLFTHNYRKTGTFGGNTIVVTCADSFNCEVAEILDNTFVDAVGTGVSKAVSLDGFNHVTHNRFARLEPADVPAVSTGHPGLECHDNIFYDNGLAAEGDNGFYVDAVNNWWGDASGPFHPTFNPGGQGDTVGEFVWFDPWYADTTFFWESGEEHPELPKQFSMTAYPNPFNGVLMIRLMPAEPAIVRVELYDILGRRVEEIWSGALGMKRDIRLDARNLATGVYFVRATEVVRHRPLALEKVLLLR